MHACIKNGRKKKYKAFQRGFWRDADAPLCRVCTMALQFASPGGLKGSVQMKARLLG